MSLIDFTSAQMATSVIITLVVMFGISVIVSFLFWLIYHQNINKG